jgi:hypothetical protein
MRPAASSDAGGAAVGHTVGHPIVGAAAGVLIQHERNKQNKHEK